MAINISELIGKVKDEGLGGGKKRPKHGMRSTHIEHLTEGSHVVRHSPYEGEETSYVAKNSKELSDKIKQYLGGKEEAAEGDTKKDSSSEESPEKV